jgi:YfiH family protein
MSLTPYLSTELSQLSGIGHGFFTREGGVSDGIYASLNCGQGSRDEKEHVAANRARVASHLTVDPTHLASLQQVHSPDAVVVEAPFARSDAPEADGMATRVRGLALGVLTADCAPVLFADHAAQVVGACHAGWKGATGGVIEATISAMESLGAARAGIVAAVGPTISAAAYEVGADYRETAIARDAHAAAFFRDGPNGRPHFDLPSYVADTLRRAGVASAEDLGVCTYGDETRLFSYRRATHRGEADYGRQISAIVIL